MKKIRYLCFSDSQAFPTQKPGFCPFCGVLEQMLALAQLKNTPWKGRQSSVSLSGGLLVNPLAMKVEWKLVTSLELRLWSRTAWVHTPALPLNCCVIDPGGAT